MELSEAFQQAMVEFNAALLVESYRLDLQTDSDWEGLWEQMDAWTAKYGIEIDRSMGKRRRRTLRTEGVRPPAGTPQPTHPSVTAQRKLRASRKELAATEQTQAHSRLRDAFLVVEDEVPDRIIERIKRDRGE